MGLGLTIKLLGTVMDLLLPYILAHIIDDITPLQDMGLVVRWGLVMLACSFLAIAGNVIANRMAAWVARETTRRLRHDLFRKISYLSNRQIDGFTVPSLISRMTTDTYNIHRMVGMMQRIGIRAPILVVGGVAVTITLDPVLALVLTCMLPVILCIVYLVSRRSIPLFTACSGRWTKWCGWCGKTPPASGSSRPCPAVRGKRSASRASTVRSCGTRTGPIW